MNSLGISKKYLRFFVENTDSRYVLIQGGRRSGKSFNVYKWLYLLSMGSEAVSTLVVCGSFPALQNAIQDFQNATHLSVNGSTILGYSAQLNNGSFFKFRSFDEYQKAQGTTCDYLFIEESLNVSEDIVTTLSMSATRQIFFAYNPTKKSYLDKYIYPTNSNYLLTTYKDNDYLTDLQISEFHKIEEIAKNPTASILQIYQYKVYCLGEFSDMGGKVFRELYSCTDSEYENIKANEMFGLDFGIVDSGDSTALVGVKLHNNILYAKQYIYSNQLANNKLLALALYNCGIDYSVPIAADYGGLGAQKIKVLVSADDGKWTEEGINYGFNIQNAKKTKIIDGLNEILQFDKIVLTDSSIEMRAEMENYELTNIGKPKGDDHAIDALRYATHYYYFNFSD